MPLVFSKSKQGTVHQVQPSRIAIISPNVFSSMFSRLTNTKTCGKCKGAK